MQCKLCLQEKPLIKNSHIIPDFMYEGLFNDKHEIAQKDFVNNRNSFPHSGIYDKYILCAKCDNEIIGSYESYAAKELFKPSISKFIENIRQIFLYHNRNIDLQLSKLNYQKTKLFLLSILWKASISNHSFFHFVNLNDTNFELIRKMLYEGCPLESDLFEVIVEVFLPDRSRPYHSIGAPRLVLFEEKQSHYAFIINSILLSFNVLNDDDKNTFFTTGYITEEGTLNIRVLDEDIARDIFDGLMGRDIPYKGSYPQ